MVPGICEEGSDMQREAKLPGVHPREWTAAAIRCQKRNCPEDPYSHLPKGSKGIPRIGRLLPPLARPLYEATKEGRAFEWTEKEEAASNQLKKALLDAPALGLPDVTKLFHLFVDEHKGIAKGVLTQALGPWSRPVAYLSKKLDPVPAGWPPCLRIIAATALLVKDANKLTLGQEIWITTPHAIEGVLKQPSDRWMSNACMTHYQSLLLNPPRVRFHPSEALNPTTLLPDPDLNAPLHDCAGILEQVRGFWKDLTDRPLPDAEATWFMNGSSFIRDGHRYVGAVVVTETNTIWAEALPSGTSAQ